MFVDEHELTVIGGRGGDGVVSFRREAFAPKGGPDGGDGGDGGDVILVASNQTHGLAHLLQVHEIKAESGRPGQGTNKAGRNAPDRLVEVPVGTVVYAQQTARTAEPIETAPVPESAFSEAGATGDDAPAESAGPQHWTVVADLDQPGKRYVAARGGRGGWGNKHFAAATNQSPRHANPGKPGETRNLRLEVKLIADVGLIGLPNAGKSTLLSTCTRAKPKIGAYPFTTLGPYVGIAELGREQKFIMADLPGLIEGAAQGKGLGHQFLRHVERTRLLLHLIDVSEGEPERLRQDHDVIVNELRAFSAELAAKPRMVVASKCDVPGARERAQALAELLGEKVHAISGITREGLKELLRQVYYRLQPASGDPEESASGPAP